MKASDNSVDAYHHQTTMPRDISSHLPFISSGSSRGVSFIFIMCNALTWSIYIKIDENIVMETIIWLVSALKEPLYVKWDND